MRWKSKHIEPEIPVEGDYKTVYRFAWWPKRIGKVTVWLEKYKQIFEYRVRRRTYFFGGYAPALSGEFGGWDLVQEKAIEKNSISIDYEKVNGMIRRAKDRIARIRL